MAFQPAAEGSLLEQRLAAFPFTEDLAPSTRQTLLENSRGVHFDRDELILRPGSSCQDLYFMERGALRVFKVFPNGREITLYLVRPGELCVLCTTCLLRGMEFPAQLQVKAPADAIAIDAKICRGVLVRDPAMQRYVFDLYTHRLSALMMLIQEVAYHRMDERLARFLLHSTRVEEGELAPIRMSHEEIADHLGTAREVVSRLLEGFEERGILSLARRKIVLLDVEALRRIAPPNSSGGRSMKGFG